MTAPRVAVRHRVVPFVEHATTKNVSRHTGHISKRRHYCREESFSRISMNLPRNFSPEFQREDFTGIASEMHSREFLWNPRLMLPITSIVTNMTDKLCASNFILYSSNAFEFSRMRSHDKLIRIRLFIT